MTNRMHASLGSVAAFINGAAFGPEVIDFTTPGTEECNTGQFMIALDVARFLSPEMFAAEMDRHLQDLRSSARLPGFDVMLLFNIAHRQFPSFVFSLSQFS